jgi:hypothetical protein
MRRVPHMKYVSEAICTVEDNGREISLYVKINPDPLRWVAETIPVSCMVANVDLDGKGNVRGIEVILNEDDKTPAGPWRVPYDVIKDSTKLAMKSAGISQENIDEVLATVEDFAVNNLGDD